MGFSIHYRSTDTMHPAQAFAIKQDAVRLSEGYVWSSCEPVLLQQQTDGFLCGSSKPSAFPAEIDLDLEHVDGMPDGTVLTLAEVLCELSRQHGVDWDIGHDYEPDRIGRIRGGVADADLLEQLETFGSVGDLLDEELCGLGLTELEPVEQPEPPSKPDAEPRVLKFPGASRGR